LEQITCERGKMTMREKLLWLAALALVVSISACGDGTSGSVMGSHQSCSAGMGGGSCEGSYRKLSGTYSADIGMARTGFLSVKAEVSVHVDSGPIRVYLVAPDGTEASVTVRPGSPGTVAGEARVSYDKFRVYFEALEGEARGVKYAVTYEYP
jgi:hypothetical protein